ncbi:class I SAM-dependent methyltransferase [Sphingomonas sp. GM_Shp_2]|uniref:TylF/MycF/NovP-related O-methyltransferase n=1 Tax=Sphingomonas sp. GM_Shp_2 TaxID=2937380 RepID=UPI002269889E|nr:class I SAM-dependent methyltransferase [Sphingomonas sp. GM_Shp_2]
MMQTIGTGTGSLRTFGDWALRQMGIRDSVGAAHVALRRWGLAPWRPLVPEESFATCIDAALDRLVAADRDHQFGDYLEFGVSRGTSMAAVFHVLRRRGIDQNRLIGFDSFAGMPTGSEEEGWDAGAFASPLRLTRRHLRTKGVDLSAITLVKGWYSDTLTATTRANLTMSKASLVMVDCDTYSASALALRFAAPLIRDRAVVVLDDWGWRAADGQPGQREAFVEFLTDNPTLRAAPLPAYFEHARVFLVERYEPH